jgi:Protein of unknown function (DUF4242)
MRLRDPLAYGRPVAMFLVLRDLPGVTRDQYSAAQDAIADAVQRTSPADREVRYFGGFFLPGSGRAVCVFGAESASDVADVNQRAGVSFTEVLEAVELRRSGPHEAMPTLAVQKLSRRVPRAHRDDAAGWLLR